MVHGLGFRILGFVFYTGFRVERGDKNLVLVV